MRDYAKCSGKFWISGTGKDIKRIGLPPGRQPVGGMTEAAKDAVILAFYLKTSPQSNMLGLYYLPLVTMAHESGLTVEGAIKALESLRDVGFCEYDEDSEVVWVYEMATYQIGEALKPGDNQVKGVQSQYDALPKILSWRGFTSAMRRHSTWPASVRTAVIRSWHRKPLPRPSKAKNRNREQEQRAASRNLCGQVLRKSLRPARSLRTRPSPPSAWSGRPTAWRSSSAGVQSPPATPRSMGSSPTSSHESPRRMRRQWRRTTWPTRACSTSEACMRLRGY